MDIFNILNKYGAKIPQEFSADFKRDFKSAFISKADSDSAVEALKNQYNSELEAVKSSFAEKEYAYASKALADSYAFSCPLAKEAVLARLASASLPVENGEIVGGAEFIDAIRLENPEAFSDAKIELSVTGPTSGKSGNFFSKSALRSAFGLPL